MDKLRLGTTALAALLLAAAPAAATTTAATATAGGAPTDSTATGAITTGGTTTGAITTGAITTGAATAGAASPVARPMASGTWRPAPLPPTEDGDQLTDVAAFGPADAWAVGRTADQDRPLIQHWDGRAWSTVRTPAVSGPSRLAAITALPGGGLWAVGHGSDRPVVLTRAGGTWRHAPRVPGTDTFATGVAGDGHGGVWVSLMEAFPARAGAEAVRTHYAHFDGHSWTLAEGGEYAGTLRPWHLARVPGTDDLWAVGQQAGVRPYAESYGD